MISLYEYFAATDDATAAAAIQCAAASLGLPAIGMVTSINPALHMAKLESLLRRVDYDRVLDDPRWCAPLISITPGNGPRVVTITESLRDCLAVADSSSLAEAVTLWTHTRWQDAGKFAGREARLADFLDELAGLAREAASSTQQLYCWMSM
ncbi:hypothetical protein [Nocardia sp. NBC_00511]|uniref:hypothetical protein n=1 Tax=Nocardia sp. NBC_00511 TaxID=2903591 RepID=UPI002F914763